MTTAYAVNCCRADLAARANTGKHRFTGVVGQQIRQWKICPCALFNKVQHLVNIAGKRYAGILLLFDGIDDQGFAVIEQFDRSVVAVDVDREPVRSTEDGFGCMRDVSNSPFGPTYARNVRDL